MPTPAPIAKPTASRLRLAATAARKSVVGQTSQARPAPRSPGGSEGALLRAHASQSASAATKTATPSTAARPSARVHHANPRSSPPQNTTRRSAARSPALIA